MHPFWETNRHCATDVYIHTTDDATDSTRHAKGRNEKGQIKDEVGDDDDDASRDDKESRAVYASGRVGESQRDARAFLWLRKSQSVLRSRLMIDCDAGD